jgi:hypothetical protein
MGDLPAVGFTPEDRRHAQGVVDALVGSSELDPAVALDLDGVRQVGRGERRDRSNRTDCPSRNVLDAASSVRSMAVHPRAGGPKGFESVASSRWE